VSSLTTGVTYTCTVRALNAVGWGPTSAGASIYVPKAPTVAPGGLKAAPTGANGEAVVSSSEIATTVTATGGSPVTGYKATCTASGYPTGSASDTGAPFEPIPVTGMTDGVTYTCKTQALNIVGAGPTQTTGATVKVGAPPAPTGVSVAPAPPTAGKVIVGYTPLEVAGVSKYEATCTASGYPTGTASDTGAPFESIPVSGLTQGITYSCKVRAYNGVGSGPYSAGVSIYVPKAPTVAPAGLKAAPTGASGEAVVSSSEIATTVTATGGSPVTGYKASCTASGYPTGFATDTAAPFEPITVTGMTDGVTYTCKTQALNIVGAGPTQTTGATVKVGAPPAPTDVSAVPTSTAKQVLVGYTPLEVAGVSKYEATCTASGYPTGTVTDTAEPFESIPVSGLTQGITYSCKVRAYNGVGSGPYSAGVSIYVPKPPTVAPGGLKAAPTGVSKEAVVSYTEVASTVTATGGSPVTSYEATCTASGYPTGFATDTAAPFEPITVTGTTDGVTYTCKTRAVNAYGPGPWQSTGATVLVGAPTAPPNVANVPGPSSGQITVTWEASTTPVALSNYIVTCTSGSSIKTVTVGDVLTTPVPGLSLTLSYRCKVAGKNANGTGPATQALTTTKPKQ